MNSEPIITGMVALYDAPELLHNVHVYGTCRLLAACSQSETVQAFVHTSSTGVVHNGATNVRGMEHGVPYSEVHLTDYSRTKHRAEVCVRLANGCNKLLTVALRLPGVYGYGDGMLVTNMLNGLRVYPGNAETKIEMLYVRNAAQAHVDALETLVINSSGLN